MAIIFYPSVTDCYNGGVYDAVLQTCRCSGPWTGPKCSSSKQYNKSVRYVYCFKEISRFVLSTEKSYFCWPSVLSTEYFVLAITAINGVFCASHQCYATEYFVLAISAIQQSILCWASVLSNRVFCTGHRCYPTEYFVLAISAVQSHLNEVK